MAVASAPMWLERCDQGSFRGRYRHDEVTSCVDAVELERPEDPDGHAREAEKALDAARELLGRDLRPLPGELVGPDAGLGQQGPALTRSLARWVGGRRQADRASVLVTGGILHGSGVYQQVR